MAQDTENRPTASPSQQIEDIEKTEQVGRLAPFVTKFSSLFGLVGAPFFLMHAVGQAAQASRARRGGANPGDTRYFAIQAVINATLGVGALIAGFAKWGVAKDAAELRDVQQGKLDINATTQHANSSKRTLTKVAAIGAPLFAIATTAISVSQAERTARLMNRSPVGRDLVSASAIKAGAITAGALALIGTTLTGIAKMHTAKHSANLEEARIAAQSRGATQHQEHAASPA